MKIRRRKSKKRYLGEKNVYEYEQLSVGLPSLPVSHGVHVD